MGRKKKAEGEAVVKMNITLPPDLKREVDSPPGGKSVNWSALAADAFRHKLAQLRAEHYGGEGMNEVIERMRAAEQVEGDEVYQQGQAAAEKWVNRHATPKPLRRLQKSVAVYDDAESYVVLLATEGNAGPAAGICRDLFDDGECGDFWGNVIGLGDEWSELADNTRFAHGFVEKAVGMWEQIESKL